MQQILNMFWQGVPAGVGHQPLAFQLLAAADVEVRPVALLAARRDTLCQPAVGQLLDGGVYPPEAQRLHDHLHIRQRPRHSRLSPIARHPALPLPPVIPLQPPPQPRPFLECHKILYLHLNLFSIVSFAIGVVGAFIDDRHILIIKLPITCMMVYVEWER